MDSRWRPGGPTGGDLSLRSSTDIRASSNTAFDPHYTDQTDAWAKGELFDWAYGKAAVDAATKDTLVLKP